jgi:cadmium resistance protein CadD (predicted permease)
MGHLLVTLAVAVGAFASTNVDDLVVLTMLFLASRTAGVPRPWQVVAGQCAGIAVLVAAAGLAALGLLIVPTRWVGLLGLAPLGLGLWALVAAMRRPPDGGAPPSAATGLTGVTGVTILNGTDNLTIYTPMFRGLEAADLLLTLAVFAAMIGVWCVAAAWLGAHLGAFAAVRRLGDRLVPLVFIAIGGIILARWAIA